MVVSYVFQVGLFFPGFVFLLGGGVLALPVMFKNLRKNFAKPRNQKLSDFSQTSRVPRPSDSPDDGTKILGSPPRKHPGFQHDIRNMFGSAGNPKQNRLIICHYCWEGGRENPGSFCLILFFSLHVEPPFRLGLVYNH